MGGTTRTLSPSSAKYGAVTTPMVVGAKGLTARASSQSEYWARITLLAISLALVTWFSGAFLVRLLLQPMYLQGLVALPGILLGQVFMVIGQAAETDMYIRGKSHQVFIKQFIATSGALFLIPILIIHFGLIGAGIACAIYYAIDATTGLLYSANKDSIKH